MNPSNGTNGDNGWVSASSQSHELLRLHRDQVAAYATKPAQPQEDSEPTASASNMEPLNRECLPASMLQLIEKYEVGHPSAKLVPLRYISLGYPDEVAPSCAAELPEDTALVSLVVTETVVDAQQIHVKTRVLLAARTTSTAAN